jgi:hypothetical protein
MASPGTQRAHRWLAWGLVAAAVAGAGFAAFRQATPAPDRAVATAPPALLPVTGWIDDPAGDTVVGPRVRISGWALAASGIRGVELHVGGQRLGGRIGIARDDIAAARPGYPDSARGGFEIDVDLAAQPGLAPGDRRSLAVVAVGNDGSEATLGHRDVVDPAALLRWRDIDPGAGIGDAGVFHLLPATSGLTDVSAAELATTYTPFVSSTIHAGVRVPVLYLRTTKGAAGDYEFDPGWDTERRCGTRRIADDALAATLSLAARHRLSVLVTLNGGIWADASCDVPEWDVNDKLEQDPANCQWNERNEVMPDDRLSHLPGSQDAPQLARALTFNVYARDVRHYKRRNLQAAGRVVAAFAREHPGLLVGASLDPDTYLNPFFDQQQWYDYNPGTLRQFRHWLAGTGPYAGQPDAPGVPDLSAYRRARPLTLGEAGRLAGRRFARWADVDPPRSFPTAPTAGRPAFWDDPWTREWERFRRHLVDLHYDELSGWLTEAGIPAARIWSAQGFMAPHPDARPFAIALASPAQNYDTGGMSIAGAIPTFGHLGAILYGAAAVNDVRMEGPLSLFAQFRALDPGWAVVEFNTADLRAPKLQPGYAVAYRSLRDLFNYGARFVSPMAWNGSNGLFAADPAYVPFTAWRNTPLEAAARDFLLSHANVPLGARLWTFGADSHADDDGWKAVAGGAAARPGRLVLTPERGRVTLMSPPELAFAAGEFDRVVLGLAAPGALRSIAIRGRRTGDARWQPVATTERNRWQTSAAGLAVPLAPDASGRRYDELRIELGFDSTAGAIELDHLALWPARRAR